MSQSQRRRIWLGIVSISVVTITAYASYRFDIPARTVFKLTGKEIHVGEDLRDRVHLTVEEFLSTTAALSIDSTSSGHIALRRDTFEIDKTIVVPVGTALIIEAGSVLRFKEGASLISYSPIVARGTKDEPIFFVAQEGEAKWGVVGLVKAAKSRFEHVTFRDGGVAVVNHQRFNGSLSLVRTDAEIANSEFLNAHGKDGVWVFRANVTIRGSLFRDSRVDCLDLDYGSGEISGNELVSCGDEGIDLMKNHDLRVFDNLIVNAGGAGIDADNDLAQIVSLNAIR